MEIPFLGEICMPALIYLVISIFVTIIECIFMFNVIVLILNILLFGFWTFILNLICLAGYPIVSWCLLLLPIIILIFI